MTAVYGDIVVGLHGQTITMVFHAIARSWNEVLDWSSTLAKKLKQQNSTKLLYKILCVSNKRGTNRKNSKRSTYRSNICRVSDRCPEFYKHLYLFDCRPLLVELGK